jgi:hypothetical protein
MELFDLSKEKETTKKLSDYSLIEADEISIPPHIWSEIKHNFEKKEITSF